ncbi:MAG: GspE/PulE family protein [Sulfuricurvum sp.]|uniref:GspE/PulE family protein n=1 Tax=Sulfuricurvum sp. TaxID=2025608 RepID=UPI002619CFBA|nr:GspE/PulE family protein [Sulfuricurvum sp.]MDD2828327.1 GspE/PulE family protein [Sulfuricurvum sp.]MDD4949718.1 GspE/PulE family protein [Sulfuricurvum sp.]
MIVFPFLDETGIVVHYPENIDTSVCIRHSLLFCSYAEVTYAIIPEADHLSALQLYNKLFLTYPIAHLSHAGYENLYLKFLEHKTDQDISQSTPSNSDFIDEELSLVDFIKNSADLLSSEESAPIIKFVNTIFYQAIKRKASDIHIETHEKKGEVRFRIDGALIKHIDLDKNIIDLIISRIKVISALDISEKRLPQDGRTQVKVAGKNLDIRVSVLPTYHGERVVLRLLMQASSIPALRELGFDEKTTSEFEELLKFSHGIILVTGPTGSGKSTTLHSFLQQLATPEKNIISIEDPVEYDAPHVSQIAVNTKAGLSFASGLRSILRQDPDIIMIGEIRDSETAHIAIQAAMTGHLVLSTLHTNNATAALTRLADMGIDKFLITSTLIGVLAQRLVRKLCPECKEIVTLSDVDADELAIEHGHSVAHPKGCVHCHYTGYQGRVAIGEFFMLDDTLRPLLKNSDNDFEIREMMRLRGMQFLSHQLIALLLNHTTGLDEIIRVGVKEA